MEHDDIHFEIVEAGLTALEELDRYAMEQRLYHNSTTDASLPSDPDLTTGLKCRTTLDAEPDWTGIARRHIRGARYQGTAKRQEVGEHP